MENKTFIVEGKDINITNLNKIFWPAQNLTKAHLIKYYTDIAPYALPYIKDRPLVMKRYPDGIHGKYFYQKNCPEYAPDWIKTISIKHSHRVINYIICNDTATLIWLSNQGCVEIHSWLSILKNVEYPDMAVIDLDPASGAGFEVVAAVAILTKKTLDYFNLNSYIKTSGATGLHIFIPILPEYNFKTVTKSMEYIAKILVQAYPEKATIDRKVENRYGKVYIDYLQNTRGKTMAFPYSLRPFSNAPVSTPVYWNEVPNLTSPVTYNINNIKNRLEQIGGDPWEKIFYENQTLEVLVRNIFY